MSLNDKGFATLTPSLLARKGQAQPAAASRAAPGSKSKAAFTLRLDAERHLRLRLASAHLHLSAQAIVAEALDRYLAELQPEIEARCRAACGGAA